VHNITDNNYIIMAESLTVIKSNFLPSRLVVQKQEQKLARFKSIALSEMRMGASMEHINKIGLKKPSAVSFELLRKLASYDPIIRICVNVIKKEVSQCDWEIMVKPNAPKAKEYYMPLVMEVYDLFEYMNANGENLRILSDRVLEDLLVCDAGVVEKVYTIDKTKIGALNSIDGASVRPIYNEYGELGNENGVAYVQYIDNVKVAEFTADEVVYMMAHPQNDVKHFGYGKSNIESILLHVQAALEADMFNIKRFTEDNVPPGILDLGNINEEQAQVFKEMWNATVITEPHAMKFVWGSDSAKKFIPFGNTQKDMQYIEYIQWLSKLKLATYGLSSIDANMFQDANRANSEVQQAISASRGVRSYKKLLEEYWTRGVIRAMGDDYKWLEFKYKDAETLDQKKQQAEIDKIYVETGVYQRNEIREREGKAPIKELDYQEELDMEIANELDAETLDGDTVKRSMKVLKNMY